MPPSAGRGEAHHPENQRMDRADRRRSKIPHQRRVRRPPHRRQGRDARACSCRRAQRAGRRSRRFGRPDGRRGQPGRAGLGAAASGVPGATNPRAADPPSAAKRSPPAAEHPAHASERTPLATQHSPGAAADPASGAARDPAVPAGAGSGVPAPARSGRAHSARRGRMAWAGAGSRGPEARSHVRIRDRVRGDRRRADSPGASRRTVHRQVARDRADFGCLDREPPVNPGAAGADGH